jgi:hypothetical protein
MADSAPAVPDSALADRRGGPELGELMAALRAVQDAAARAAAPPDVLSAAARSLREVAALLDPHAVDDGAQHAGYRFDLPGRGHPLLVPFVPDVRSGDVVEGRVTFGAAHLSGGGRVHAGVLALTFGEVLGVLSVSGGRPPSRNAALRVDYRRPTPAGVELRLVARLTAVEGRKVRVQGELLDGDEVLAEAEGLYVRPRGAPLQPLDITA